MRHLIARLSFYALRRGSFALLVGLLPAMTQAELQTTLQVTAPNLTPGNSGSFTADTVNGPAGSTTSNLVNPYAGVLQYVLSAGTGRFSSLTGTRYGVQFDSFQLFQSFLSTNFFTMVSSSTNCPGSANYTYNFIRFRSPDAPRFPTDASLTSTVAGGALTYNSGASPVFQSSSSFALQGATTSGNAYSFSNSGFGACASGVLKTSTGAGVIPDPYGRFFFGSNFAFYYSNGGNPLVAVLFPSQTLTAGVMSNLAKHGYSGLFTAFTTPTVQTQNQVYAIPDSAGTTYTLKTITNYSDPTQWTTFGTLACTSLNSPITGFCSGTLTLNGVTGTGAAACHFGSTASQDVMSCNFQYPNNNTIAGSLIATRSSTSVLSLTISGTPPNIASSGSGTATIAVTLQNLTGSQITGLSNPSLPAENLVAPFTNTGSFAGSGGTCGTTLNGFSSCTMNVTFDPSTYGTELQTLRVAYNNQSTTVNATSAIRASADLASLAISPNSSSFANGTTQQFTATATYSGGQTQDVSLAATWGSSASSVATISSTGNASFISNGSTTISASLAGTSTNFTPTIYSAPPNPSGFSATPNGYTQVDLSWASGGGITSAFQVAYTTGSTAPADCNAGTVISSGVIGASTTYSVTSLNPSTQYAFRVCAVGSGAGTLSSGVTATATTNTPHYVFATANTYRGAFGSIYFADYICQSEAASAGFSGIWRAVIGDESVNPSAHVSLSQSIYNLRPSGSGGIQLVSTAGAFWGAHGNTINYNAAGGAPGSANVWSGSTTAGLLFAGRTCSSWTTSSSGVNGQYGQSTATNTNWESVGQLACNNLNSLYCINLQSAAAAPPDPTGFSVYSIGPTSISFLFASGGGTTAAYKLAYQTGGTAPANCSSGTVVGAATIGINPSTYTLTGLTANQQYSFRLCAVNSDQSAASSGATLTTTTLTAGSQTTVDLSTRQIIFGTAATYNGSFGGIYYADFICQNEASSAGLSGVWKAILSDESVSALSRIAIGGKVYNNRPYSSGGFQEIATNSAAFWASSVAYASNYTAAGGTPGSTNTWTGSQATGAIQAGVTCSSWTTGSSGTTGRYGGSNGTGNVISNNSGACNNVFSLYCTNQQTASAAPANPTGFATYTLGPTSLSFIWASGGTTTAAYKLAYQTGGTAPANCSSGTVIGATTLGVNPTSYTVTGLTANTQYSFRLCAVNSDQSAASAGTTLTTTTLTAGSSVTYDLTSRQVVFATTSTVYGNMGSIYFSDFICQDEATTAGLSGIWKAIISDESNNASTRISIPGTIYNFRPLGSGGMQQVAADSSGFWSSIAAATVNYTASGGTPGATTFYDGSLATGLLSASNTCSSWTTSGSGTNGRFGTSNTTGNIINSGTAGCNTARTLLCTNQQSSSGAPTDPTGFATYTLGANSLSFIWVSGGGTTAGYKLAYQTGGTAPASCSAGTVISASTLGYNPTSYTVTGLSSSQQYSFRLCAVNSDQSSVSAGVTVTATTLAPGSSTTIDLTSRQVVFATTALYNGSFGGVYFGDYICQSEAESAGLSGIWKAILSDESTNASSRISIPGKVYNNRPLSSGGIQEIASDSTAFWASSASYAVNYNAGGTSPGATTTYTGSTAAGLLNAGNTCTSWTTASSGTNGASGTNTNTGNVFSGGAAGCNNNRTLYCTNQQSSSSAPSDPSGFSTYTVGPTSVSFIWTSGGGTTAAYKLAYQTGGTAPANCSSGTVVPASTLGVNPTSYTLSGLSNSQQYSFRLCAVNSDQSSASTGVTVTTTTLAAGQPVTVDLTNRQVLFSTTATYHGSFGGIYMADFACQLEALNASLTGVWKAVLSDESTSALSRIAIPGKVYNNRPLDSGGIQEIAANSSSFWSAASTYRVDYNAGGTTPGTTVAWTGSQSTGAIQAGVTCTSWTTNSASLTGRAGPNTTSGNIISTASNACNNSRVFYCTNQQTAAAAPSNPTGFIAYSNGPTMLGLKWANGGGTTAAYKLAYQTGGTAPASCTAGTVISPQTLGVNPTTYVLTGLTASTQYSFRLCAMNSDLSSASSGTTLTVTTAAATTTVDYSATQVLFPTATRYNGNIGGLYFADFACQIEANSAGLGGVWKALIGDDTTAANARLSFSGPIYGNRPAASGGIQYLAANSTEFWLALYEYAPAYSAGGTTPVNANTWTGAAALGAVKTGFNCNGWTSNSGAVNGGYATHTSVFSTNVINANNTTCNTTMSLYCLNRQTASATPSNPGSFAAGSVTTSTIPLTWASGGGTTAGYKMAYQTGGTAPANCTTGTLIAASTLGVNPSSYTITGLSAGTQYSIRLCAINSDDSAASSGVTVTTTTTSLSTPANQTVFATGTNYYPIWGGLYFADFICQQEAINNALAGVWKAAMSDSGTAASGRIALAATIWNNRPAGSGGPQQVATSATFFNGAYSNAPVYSASGGAPGGTATWTGSTTTGGSFAGRNCSDWTTLSASTNGQYGNNNQTTAANAHSTNQTACNTARPIYCVDQQTASAAPSNPSGFAAMYTTSSGVGFTWANGGGTTAAYQIAYQTGGTAPANCSSGTVVSAATIGINNPTNYTVTGLSSGTQYSFRLCAMNSDLSAASAGVTATVTTRTSGQPTSYSLGSNQLIFVTNGNYRGNFGGIYFADYICQAEAESNSLTGVWKAVLSDSGTAANARLSVSGSIYNMRDIALGGFQRVTNSTNFWNTIFSNPVTYTAAGTTDSVTFSWTGSTAAGGVGANTCSDWTSAVSTVTGQYGTNNSATTGISTGARACNNLTSFNCINQQTASAAPNDPTGFAVYSNATTSLSFVWASGGGTTAAYKMAYQTGGTAPANCSSGTVISAATLGVAPTTYTLSGLTANTQYSFRLCSTNSDQSSVSSGVTVTATTASSGSTITPGTTQMIFATEAYYSGKFGGPYFADYACQKEADSAGLTGVWKAILSTSTVDASSRISLSARQYNTRTAAAGGIQQVSDSTNFWAGNWAATTNYSAAGNSPGATRGWTGTATTGLVDSTNHCSDWTSSSSSVNGRYGTPATAGTGLVAGTATCANLYTFYCANQQSASAAPADPASFSAIAYGTNFISFKWASGGGTTAAYKMAYQTGGTAPANCSAGTVVSASTLGVNPTTYTLTGLSSNTQYSFRLCATNSDQSSVSTGLTTTVTTTSSGTTYNPGTTTFLFGTTSLFTGYLGGLYMADFICQTEATNAGHSGIWKAMLSDEATDLTTHVSLSGSLYNLRPGSSGGIQEISDTTGFLSNSTLRATPNYNAAGASPGSTIGWTGSLSTGLLNAGNTCTSWTTSSASVNGRYGTNNVTVNYLASNVTNCGTSRALWCVNQQSASAAPPDPSGFGYLTLGTTSVGLTWVSGGGTTAGYKIAYQTGGTAPANCSSGTVIGAATVGYNPTSYNVTGLTTNTQYSFRICAVNSDQSSVSTGVTQTITTSSTGSSFTMGSTQFMFTSTGTYYGNFGGIYFGDYVCQSEAETAGLAGIWKAVLSDESVSAASRLTISGPVYNLRPSGSGGIQRIMPDAVLFSTPTLEALFNYTAAGAAPASAVGWTGSTAAGLSSTGNTCTNWTVGATTGTGAFGRSNVAAAQMLNNGNTNCGTLRSLFCINQQSSSAAPSDPTGFNAMSTGGSFVTLNWASGGGTTAAYKIAYQTGGTAPANCSAGTVIGAATLGVGPTTYTVTGLSASTQYSFRLCAANSDQSSISAGVTVTATTSSGGTSFAMGSNQFMFPTTATYYPHFGGMYFADYICQNEASTAGLSGIWRAFISDGSVAASSHITLSGPIYNLRPGASGGIQRISDSSSLYSLGGVGATFNYSATGASPGLTNHWTGTATTGLASGTSYCSNWTSSLSTSVGRIGVSNGLTTPLDNSNQTCNSTRSLLCINQQSAAATPSDPTGLTADFTGASYVGLTWANGGGTTAAYKLAYQSGGTAPADCNSGTTVSPATLGVAPTSYAITGLSPSTQYSFRLCALNSDLSAMSSGTTLTLTTTASALTFTPGTNQYFFTTAATYQGNFGGLMFADFICQNEASAASLGGVWKAVLGDDTTSLASRLTLNSVIYNMRPASSGGSQRMASNIFLLDGILQAGNNYTATGATTAATRAWTGSAALGALNATQVCANTTGWTSNSGAVTARYGNVNSITTGWHNSGANAACNNSYALYCINQQTAAATPANPGSFSSGSITTSSIQFSWTSGGGTTAGYKLTYQLGATPPNNCTTGTVVSAATLGVNPTTYTVTGLSAATQYSFRLCATNSDQSSDSSGLTATVSTN